jgi:hypothetical protein
MRTRWMFAFALLLAACGGSPTETLPPTLATLPETTPDAAVVTEEAPPVDAGAMTAEVADPEATFPPESATIQAFVIATPPPLGTLVIITPVEPEFQNPGFDSLVFTQQSGVDGPTLRVELYSDGTMIRDGVTSQVSAENIATISQMLNQINFFFMQGQFESVSPPSEAFRYSLTVNSPIASRTIFAEDGLTPPELRTIFSAILGLGEPQPPTAQPTD